MGNKFKCILQSGSGSGATITVLYSSDLYNKTITCSDGTTTLTDTTTSSGSTTFNVVDEGTWTITCDGRSRTVDVTLNYTAQLSITKTISVYSAANDTLSFTDYSGSKTVTTDNTGVGSVSITFLPNQSITFTSSVAKDITTPSNDYSKTITFDNNTTEVYIMPDGVLYWYGYNNGMIGQVYDTAYTSTVTFNTNNVELYGNGGGRAELISQNSIDFTNYTSVKCVATQKAQRNTAAHYCLTKIGTSTTNGTNFTPTDSQSQQTTSTTEVSADMTCAITLSSGYPFIENNRIHTTGYSAWTYVSALWLE